MKRRIEVIPEETLDAMRLYPWPRNVRELANLVERSVILSPGPCLAVPPGISRASRTAELRRFERSARVWSADRFAAVRRQRCRTAGQGVLSRAPREPIGSGWPWRAGCKVVPAPRTNWAAK